MNLMHYPDPFDRYYEQVVCEDCGWQGFSTTPIDNSSSLLKYISPWPPCCCKSLKEKSHD